MLGTVPPKCLLNDYVRKKMDKEQVRAQVSYLSAVLNNQGKAAGGTMDSVVCDGYRQDGQWGCLRGKVSWSKGPWEEGRG